MDIKLCFKYNLGSIAILMLSSINLQAQIRFVEPFFLKEDITIVEDIYYSTNLTKNYLSSNQLDSLLYEEDLHMDIYMPSPLIDPVEKRPVVVIPHGGLYWDQYLLTCHGSKKDLATVELAMQLSQLGYVVVAPQLRTGSYWLDPGYYVNLKSQLYAKIRASIDVRNSIKYLRHDILDGNNEYRLDPDKFVLWGSNDGGAVATLSAYYHSDEELMGPRYQFASQPDTFFLYEAAYFGDITGSLPGFDPAFDSVATNLVSPYASYNDSVQMTIIMQSDPDIDSSFIQAGDPPGIFLIPTDHFTGAIEIYPPIVTNVPVYPPFSAFPALISRLVNNLGLNDAWRDIVFEDSIANTRLLYHPDPTLGKMEGLIGIRGDTLNRAPWVYWSESECELQNPMVEENAHFQYPGSSEDKGRQIMADVIRYFAPRACITLDLECKNFISSVKQEQVDLNLKIHPNPNDGNFTISSTNEIINKLVILDFSGRPVFHASANEKSVHVDLSHAAKGIYFAQINIGDRMICKKVIVY